MTNIGRWTEWSKFSSHNTLSVRLLNSTFVNMQTQDTKIGLYKMTVMVFLQAKKQAQVHFYKNRNQKMFIILPKLEQRYNCDIYHSNSCKCFYDDLMILRWLWTLYGKFRIL